MPEFESDRCHGQLTHHADTFVCGSSFFSEHSILFYCLSATTQGHDVFIAVVDDSLLSRKCDLASAYSAWLNLHFTRRVCQHSRCVAASESCSTRTARRARCWRILSFFSQVVCPFDKKPIFFRASMRCVRRLSAPSTPRGGVARLVDGRFPKALGSVRSSSVRVCVLWDFTSRQNGSATAHAFSVSRQR